MTTEQIKQLEKVKGSNPKGVAKLAEDILAEISEFQAETKSEAELMVAHLKAIITNIEDEFEIPNSIVDEGDGAENETPIDIQSLGADGMAMVFDIY